MAINEKEGNVVIIWAKAVGGKLEQWAWRTNKGVVAVWWLYEPGEGVAAANEK